MIYGFIILNILISYILFNSFLILISYILLAWEFFNIFNIKIDILFTFILIISIFLFIIFINIYIKKELNDKFIKSILKYKIYKKNIYDYIFIFLFSIISVYLAIYFKDFIFLFTIVLNSILISLYCDSKCIPLIIGGWITLPLVMDEATKFRIIKGNLCLGEVIAHLKKGSGISVIPLNSKYVWEKVNQNYCIDLKGSKNYHIAIVGSSGSGKSTLAKNIASKFQSFIIFDIHGEYNIDGRKIDMSMIKVNPLSLLNSSPRQRALEVAYTIKSLFKLGNLQTMDLYNIILDAYAEKGILDDDKSSWNIDPPTFLDVYSVLSRKKKNITSNLELQRYLSIEPYILFLINEIFSENKVDINEIFSENKVIFDFSKITVSEIKYILIETILKSILSYIYSKGFSELYKLIVIDEAPFIFSRESGAQLMERLIAESRKFGLGFVIISQSPEYLKKILTNIEFLFVFNIIEPNDREYIAKLISSGDNEEYKAIYESLMKLDRGFMITKDKNVDETLLVHIKLN